VPEADDDGSFSVYHSGRLIGNETFSVRATPDGFHAIGDVSLRLTTSLTQHVDLFMDRDYGLRSLSATGTRDGKPFALRAAAAAGKLSVQRDAADRTDNLTIEVPQRYGVLLSNAFHHVIVLLRQFDRGHEPEQTLPLLTGGRELGFVRLEEIPARLAVFAGNSHLLRVVLVDINGLRGAEAFIWHDSLLKLSLPVQKLEVVRDGIPGFHRGTSIASTEPEPAWVNPSVRTTWTDMVIPQPSGAQLVGTLGTPEAGTSLPGVLLVGGSGPQDRNGNTGPGGIHLNLYRDMAEYLCGQGFAVLRYDERGTGASGGDFAAAGLTDLTADAAAALSALISRPEIDPARVGIVGHSEGGLIAAILAAQDPRVKAIAMLGTSGRPLDEILVRQYERLLEARLPTEELTVAVERRRRSFETIKATGNWDDPNVEAQLRTAAPPARRRWYEEQFATVPTNVLRRVHCAVAIFHGGRDVQVDEGEAYLLADALSSREHGSHTLRVFPDLDHLFLRSRGRGLSEYADSTRRLDAEFLHALADWLDQALRQ
jgi:pimeloyl-ACP methyl ester carboxylesterase